MWSPNNTILKFQIKESGTIEGLEVIKVLMDMRQFRMGLIQTSDQLRFSYLAIIEGAKKILSSNPDAPFLDSDNVSHAFDLIIKNLISIWSSIFSYCFGSLLNVFLGSTLLDLSADFTAQFVWNISIFP
jgi:hypothetical protein